MENEVLANAGVDVFEEMFKLIFAKLYDEYLSGNYKNRLLEFRNTGQTEKELKDKIEKLLTQAIDKWQGVFNKNTKIALSYSHLAICVSSLQDIKLFNSNLDIVDDAFEYLINAENVILSPHIAGWTIESKEKLAQTIVDKIKAKFS